MTENIDMRYLFRITDGTGMFQHAVLGVPDPSEGYTSDDNARALMLADLLFERSGDQQYEDLIARYLSFLLYAEKGRHFRNFMDYDRQFTEKRGSEDCFGRCILALAFTASRKTLPESIRGCAESMLRHTVPSCKDLIHPKGIAYAAVGLSLWEAREASPPLELLRQSLLDTYQRHRKKNWHWFESKITYCSGILPLAVLCAFPTDSPEQKIGLESLDFLSQLTFQNGMFVPVGCKGWMKRGRKPAVYDEQPVEACSMMLACLRAYEVTGGGVYLEQARQCFFWYLGRNIARTPMIDTETGGCRDGLKQNGLNGNEGAESLLCWLTAALLAERNGWYPSGRSGEMESKSVPGE